MDYLSCLFWLQKTAAVVLLNLRSVRERPPSTDVSISSEVFEVMKAQGGYNDLGQMTVETDIAADGIDWDITLDSSQIDWDIGTVEETEENGNGLGPYEIVNASDILPSPRNDSVESHQTANEEGFSAPEVSASEISWDISVDNPQVDVIEEDSSQNNAAELRSLQNNLTAERSPLLETEYRNKILDDLFEVCINGVILFYLTSIFRQFFFVRD